jgi:ribulose-phosphate 3-epimerase
MLSKPIEIIPSILTSNPIELKDMIEKCEGNVERVSIDIIDGKFASNKTIDPSFLVDFDTSLKIDYQLMVIEPIHWVERCVRGQADRIIGHIESMSNQIDFVAKVQEVGSLIGLAINLETPVSELESTVLTDLDVVLVMSAKVGFGGQPFDSKALEKISKLNETRRKNNYRFKIQVDGGINEASIYNVFKKGADEVSIGRKLFEGDLTNNINKFEKLINI